MNRSARAAAPAWHWRHLLDAPHRLAFFLAIVVLMFASAWWVLVQGARLGDGWGLRYAVSPSLLHATVMTFGFMPLFFAGFLFTAGPRWLGTAPPKARQLLMPLSLQAVGWLNWLVGGHVALVWALAGLLAAWLGLAWVQVLFWGLLRRSQVSDRLHARVIGVAGLLGLLSVGGVALALVLQAPELARLCVLSGLWASGVATYMAVAHRMIPFFTASAIPLFKVWSPKWLLHTVLAGVALELLAIWLEWAGVVAGGSTQSAWMLTRGLAELALGALVLYMALAWGLAQSLKIRLLGMLHLGLVWLGVSWVLAGLSQWLGLSSGVAALGLGPLHALTMGFFGSLMLAMVTRVSCGHSGRPLLADNVVWGLFWALQLATLWRIGSALPNAAPWLMSVPALLWALVAIGWGARWLSGYARARADGQAG